MFAPDRTTILIVEMAENISFNLKKNIPNSELGTEAFPRIKKNITVLDYIY